MKKVVESVIRVVLANASGFLSPGIVFIQGMVYTTFGLTKCDLVAANYHIYIHQQ